MFIVTSQWHIVIAIIVTIFLPFSASDRDCAEYFSWFVQPGWTLTPHPLASFHLWTEIGGVI